MKGWVAAVQAADELQEEHPGWRVRAVRRRNGPGIEAHREGDGVCSITGSPEEVRAALRGTHQVPDDADLGSGLIYPRNEIIVS